MGRRMKCREYTVEERKQIRHVEKLEEEMECELRMDYSKMSEWVDRFIAELEKTDCCSEDRTAHQLADVPPYVWKL